MSKTPEIGIHRGVPFDDYLAWDAVSNSSQGPMLRSPAHYLAALTAEREPSDAMRFGSLLHCGALEPAEVAGRYAVMPAYEKTIRRADGSEYKNPKATTAYRDARDQFREDNADKEVVEQDQFDRVCGMIQALHANDAVREWFAGGVETEVSLCWRDEPTGLLCKARVDALPKTDRLIDLKTTRDGQDFAWSIYKFHYHRQAAFYGDGWHALTGERRAFCLVAMETEPPFAVRAAPVGDETVDAGRVEYRRLLGRIAECRASDDWPGYPAPSEGEWNLPESKMPRTELTFGGQ